MKKYLVLLLSLVTLQSYGMGTPVLTPEEKEAAELQAGLAAIQEALASLAAENPDRDKILATLGAMHELISKHEQEK